MNSFTRVAILVSTATIFLSGCVDCMVKGIEARECSRIKHKEESFERLDLILSKLNTNFNKTEFGKKFNAMEESKYYRKFCVKYENQSLPENPLTVSQLDVGNYFRHSFCKNKFDNPGAEVWRKEVRLTKNYGSVEFFVIKNKVVIDYSKEPITYFENGYKYGTANFKKRGTN